MSSESVSQLQEELTGTYIVVALNCLFFYESIVTLSQEVNVVWRRPSWTVMTWLYAFMRYGTCIDCILVLIPTASLESCKTVVYMDDAIKLTQFLCLASMRAYALLGGKYRLVAGLIFVLNLVPFATNMFRYATSVVTDGVVVCTALSTASESLNLSLSLITRITVIIADVLVLVVTWMKTAQLYREARRLKINAPLATMLLRDGTIYFIILLVINVLEAVEHDIPVLATTNAIGPFFNILPPIIVGRFILNLRQSDTTANSWNTGRKTASVQFLGDIGQHLSTNADAEERECRPQPDVRCSKGDTLCTISSAHARSSNQDQPERNYFAEMNKISHCDI